MKRSYLLKSSLSLALSFVWAPSLALLVSRRGHLCMCVYLYLHSLYVYVGVYGCVCVYRPMYVGKCFSVVRFYVRLISLLSPSLFRVLFNQNTYIQRQEAPSLLYTPSTSSSTKDTQVNRHPSSASSSSSATATGPTDSTSSTRAYTGQRSQPRTSPGGSLDRSHSLPQDLATDSSSSSSSSFTLKLGLTPLTKPLAPQALGVNLMPYTLLVNLTFHRIEQHLFLARAWATSAAGGGAGNGARLYATPRGQGVRTPGSSSYLAAIGGAGAAILTPSVAVLNAFRKPQLPVCHASRKKRGRGTFI